MSSPQTRIQGPPVMTLGEVQEALQIGRKTAYEMCHGPLAHLVVRVGGSGWGIRIRRAGFYEWLDGQGSGKEGGR